MAARAFTLITSVPARRQIRTSWRVSVVLAGVSWPLAAANASPTTLLAGFLTVSLLALLILRPRPGGALDASLLMLLAGLGFVLFPLPAAIAASLNPWASGPVAGWAPLARDLEAAERAVLLAGGALAMFWSARAALTDGGLRRTVFAIGVLGTMVSIATLTYAALGLEPALRPDSVHLSAWPMLAIPLCAGLALTGQRVWRGRQSHPPAATGLAATAALVSGLGLLVLGGHGAALTLALVVGAAMLVLVWTRWLPRGTGQLAAVLSVAGLIAVGLADVSADGLPTALSAPAGGLSMGTASGRHLSEGLYAALVRQGGLPLILPTGVVLVLLAREGLRAIAGDASRSAVAIRIGAAVGLGALALLCGWDTPLVTPANAALAAVLAAVLVHSRQAPAGQ